MTSFKDAAGKVGSTLGSAGKTTLKGAGIFAMGTLKVLGEAADIQRRDKVRQQLEGVSDYDLDIAIEILQNRKEKKSY